MTAAAHRAHIARLESLRLDLEERIAQHRRALWREAGVDIKVNIAKASPRYAEIDRDLLDAAVERLKNVFVRFFATLPELIADQVAPALQKAAGDGDPFDDERITDALRRLRATTTDAAVQEAIRLELRGYILEALGRIDMGDWAILIEPTARELEAVTEAAGMSAMRVAGFNNAPSIVDQVNEEALRFATQRAAELVGMRRRGDEWVENPRARWRISESTRGLVASDVVTAIEEGWSTRRLADQLSRAYAFSDARAETIARTETNRANNHGNMIAYRNGGVTGKIWLAGNILPGSIADLPCPICRTNAAAGVIPIDEPFPSGADSPPEHPNCRCAVAPVDINGEPLVG